MDRAQEAYRKRDEGISRPLNGELTSRHYLDADRILYGGSRPKDPRPNVVAAPLSYDASLMQDWYDMPREEPQETPIPKPIQS